MSEFFEVEVEAGEGLDEGTLLRFKQVSPSRPVLRARFDGSWWSIEAPGAEAHAGLVEDSSDGEAVLIFGGLRGLRLVSETDGKIRREPYLLLARGSELA